MSRNITKKLVLAIVGIQFLLCSCSRAPVTGRRQLKLVPDSTLNSMGLQAYQEFLSGHRLSQNAQQTQMVKRVGTRIADAVERFSREEKPSKRSKRRDDAKWEFNLIESKEVNAFAMPGGKVAVYTGIMPVVKDDAGLAVVLGHEIAHVIAGHGNERMSQALLAQLGETALSEALAKNPAETRDLFLKVYGVGTQVGVLLPYSRLHETEADHLGLIFMAMAGYDPQAAVAFWQRMADAGKNKPRPPAFLATHPPSQQRIEDIRQFLPEAMRYYRQHGVEARSPEERNPSARPAEDVGVAKRRPNHAKESTTTYD